MAENVSLSQTKIPSENEVIDSNDTKLSADMNVSEENKTNIAENHLNVIPDEGLDNEISSKYDENEFDKEEHKEEDKSLPLDETNEPEQKEISLCDDEKSVTENDEEKNEETLIEEQEKIEEQKIPEQEQVVEEEEGYVEEPPPDPAAPLELSESKENIKPPFVLRPDQIAEVEQLWEVYQNYTPAYTDIDGYITEKELVYMLKSLLLMTYTPEQLQELIAFCVKPPDPQGRIHYDQFLKMVILRQRDFPVEDELRSALQVFDPGRTGAIDREYLKEVLAKQGHKMPQKQLDNLIKEVDISNDGTIGIEDVVGTMCIDLNKEDLLMLRASIYPPEENASTSNLQ